MKAELKWGLHCHILASDQPRWWMWAIQKVTTECRGLRSLDEFDLEGSGEHQRMIVKEIRQYLQAHFGVKIDRFVTRFDLTYITQKWLRNLLWDFLADELRSADPARGRSYYYSARQAIQKLGAFLETPGWCSASLRLVPRALSALGREPRP
ncbi:hypothetical protein [Nonomuraea sp. NPDC048901]|uniref:hypothetical protein n=1 Tax=Nonomuraea sp. NPDC048901 TaxID=3155627 RepID=UPI0033DD181F